jgi:hypothetical protein
MDEDNVPVEQRTIIRAFSRLPKSPNLSPEFYDDLLKRLKEVQHTGLSPDPEDPEKPIPPKSQG